MAVCPVYIVHLDGMDISGFFNLYRPSSNKARYFFFLYFVKLMGAHMPGGADNPNILASEGCFHWEFPEYLAVYLK